MKRIVKKNYKILIGIVIGIIISTTIVYSAENILTGEDISYDNKTSGEETVQGAIDELYEKANKSKAPKPNNTNIVAVYYYDETKGSEDFCVTGDEETCKVNTCYLNKAKDSCPSGTIVEYKVNDNDTVRFHVMKDNGSKMILQSQQNTLNSIQWYTENNNSYGPTTALSELEKATENWANVNTFDYSIGDDKSTLGYSGCNGSQEWTTTPYILEKKGIKARMITMQEVISFGCNNEDNNNIVSCPIWMYNYLKDSINFGGTINDSNALASYWTMSTAMWKDIMAFVIYKNTYSTLSTNLKSGARAVVEINK